jgi:cell envelope-related function transcriptional attenuator common domain
MASRSVPGPYDPLPPHLDPRGRHRGRHGDGRWRHGSRNIALSVATLVSIAALVVSGYVWYTYRGINNGVPRGNVAVGHAPTGKNGVKHDIDGKDENILLVGNDDRTNMTNAEVKMLKVGRDGGSMATDTMMIVHVPADGKKATLISLPRDSYVSIPGHGMNKLNAAYVLGYNGSSGTYDDKRTAGANLLISTVQDLTGLTINHYVQVSLMGFYDISNAIGGVTVDLCHAVDDTVAHNRAIGSDGGSGLVLSAGKHTMQGVQALEFVRQRHGLPNGDLDRVRRQQYFLAAAFRKVANVGLLFKLNALGDAVKRNLFMDSGLDLISLAQQMENLSANNIVGRTIPFERFEDTPVGSVEVVSPAQVQAFVDKLINPPAPATPTSTPSSHATSSGSSASKPATSSSGPAPIDSKCIN